MTSQSSVLWFIPLICSERGASACHAARSEGVKATAASSSSGAPADGTDGATAGTDCGARAGAGVLRWRGRCAGGALAAPVARGAGTLGLRARRYLPGAAAARAGAFALTATCTGARRERRRVAVRRSLGAADLRRAARLRAVGTLEGV